MSINQATLSACAHFNQPSNFERARLLVHNTWPGTSFFYLPQQLTPPSLHSRRCVSCLGCKECKFRVDSISFKENQEYQVILEGLSISEETGKWTAAYPFCVPPTDL
jgi:hypothetical protein